MAICKDTCPKPKCADINEQLKLQAEGQLTAIAQEGDENDPFDRPEDDTVTTSTSVFVAQPGSEASGKKYLDRRARSISMRRRQLICLFWFSEFPEHFFF